MIRTNTADIFDLDILLNRVPLVETDPRLAAELKVRLGRRDLNWIFVHTLVNFAGEVASTRVSASEVHDCVIRGVATRLIDSSPSVSADSVGVHKPFSDLNHNKSADIGIRPPTQADHGIGVVIRVYGRCLARSLTIQHSKNPADYEEVITLGTRPHSIARIKRVVPASVWRAWDEIIQRMSLWRSTFGHLRHSRA